MKTEKTFDLEEEKKKEEEWKKKHPELSRVVGSSVFGGNAF
jgi:hypothetical protein